MEEIKKTIQNITEENQDKVDWTKVWSERYPVLATYQKEVDVLKYASQIRKMLDELSSVYHYNDTDAMLVLKDILAHEWKDNRK